MDNAALTLARQHAPCCIYSRKRLTEQARLLQSTFPGFDILYSVKANPFPPVVQALAELGIGADAASAGEVALAARCGIKSENIYFSAAGKSRRALLAAWDSCHLIADSLGEAERIGQLAAERGETKRIGIRVHPAFDMDGGAGSTSKFGIDIHDMPRLRELLRRCPVDVCGIHIHLRSQNLDAAVLEHYYERCFALAQEVQRALECRMEYINFGGGVGIAYSAAQTPLDRAALLSAAQRVAEENRRTLRARLLIESGRFLTAQAGTYFLPVVDKKVCRGTTYLVVENGLNGFQKMALEAMVRTAAGGGEPAPQEPLFTGVGAFPVTGYPMVDAGRIETVDIVGNLCCATDVVQRDYTGAALDVGDIVAIGNTGAYARTLSPLLFSSHDAPAEFLI